MSHLVVGRPSIVKLSQNEIAVLSFKISTEAEMVNINIQYYTGKALVYIEKDE